MQKATLRSCRSSERLIIKLYRLWCVYDKTVVYIDNGISQGMVYGIKTAIKANRKVEFRKLYKSTSLTIEECISKYLK